MSVNDLLALVAKLSRATRFEYTDGWMIWKRAGTQLWRAASVDGVGHNLTIDGRDLSDDEEEALLDDVDAILDFPSLEAAEAALAAWRGR